MEPGSSSSADTSLLGTLLKKEAASLPAHKQRYLFTTFSTVAFIFSQIFGVYLIFDFPAVLSLWLLSVGAALFLLHRYRAVNVYFLPSAVCVLSGVLLGLTAAVYNWQKFYEHVTFFDSGTHYRNVVPTSPAESVLDAAKLQFSHQSIVETTRSVGYRHKGVMYCIAPVVEKDADVTGKIGFWAVGINCCEPVGHFYCDDAIDQPSHTAAVVLARKSSVFVQKPATEIYQAAQLKAEGQFHLPHEDSALYVRWMKDPSKYRASFVFKSVLFFFVSLAGMLLFSFFLALLLTKGQLISMLNHVSSSSGSGPPAQQMRNRSKMPGSASGGAAFLDRSYGSVPNENSPPRRKQGGSAL
mmetsp:Transcript_22266/g.56237  ORF Transcript_22266/g.56237 Transcript_22266/m.56237 type:complete len:355 (+) Transcript_22266:600-1664(+)